MKGTSHKILSVVLAFVLVVSMFAVVAAPASAAVNTVVFTPAPATAGATAQYNITFTAVGAVGAGLGTITITFPAGTTVPTTIAKTAFVVNGVAGTVDAAVNGRTVTIVNSGAIVAAPAQTVIFTQLAGIKNPPLAGAAYTGTLETSGDIGAVASAAFVINTEVSFTPARASTGSTVTVIGVGFAANSSIDIGTVAGNNGALGAGTTDANGAFSVACVANAAAPISATDGAGNTNNSVAALVIIPSVTMTPTTAIVGTTVTLTPVVLLRLTSMVSAGRTLWLMLSLVPAVLFSPLLLLVALLMVLLLLLVALSPLPSWFQPMLLLVPRPLV